MKMVAPGVALALLGVEGCGMAARVIAGRESRAQRLHHYAEPCRPEVLSPSGLKSLGTAAERMRAQRTEATAVRPIRTRHTFGPLSR